MRKMMGVSHPFTTPPIRGRSWATPAATWPSGRSAPSAQRRRGAGEASLDGLDGSTTSGGDLRQPLLRGCDARHGQRRPVAPAARDRHGHRAFRRPDGRPARDPPAAAATSIAPARMRPATRRPKLARAVRGGMAVVEATEADVPLSSRRSSRSTPSSRPTATKRFLEQIRALKGRTAGRPSPSPAHREAAPGRGIDADRRRLRVTTTPESPEAIPTRARELRSVDLRVRSGRFAFTQEGTTPARGVTGGTS